MTFKSLVIDNCYSVYSTDQTGRKT